MRIVDEAQNILEKHHYTTSRLGEDMLQFEDETLLGFICELPLRTIVESWSSIQDEFLKRNAIVLRHSALKAWNLYSVFLSPDAPDEDDRRALVTIEEDFRASRKVVHTGIQTVTDVTRALYPFIPIQNIASLEESDSLHKLRGRLSELPRAAVDLLLNERVSDEQSILKRFQEAHEIKAN
jgi:hypothetical protein